MSKKESPRKQAHLPLADTPASATKAEASLQPSLDTWRELYSYAQQIKDMAPWRWMTEEALFVIVDPKTREKCYCMVMGEVGEHLSVALYLGDAGLHSLIDVQEGLLDPFELYFNQKCLSLSFEDRELVTQRDREIFKALGLKFRGRKQYPLFRFHEPGYEPWYLDGEQEAFLQLALPQIMAVIDAAQKQMDYFLLDDDKVRCFTPIPDGDGWKWEESAIEPVAPAKHITVPKLNELEVKRLQKQFPKSSFALEFDYSFFPGKIMDGPKPYYPRIVMVVAQEGPIVSFEFVDQEADVYGIVLQQLRSAIEKMGHIPEAVLVKRQDLAYVLEHYAPAYGFEVHLLEYLPAMEEAMDGLQDTMGSR